MSTALHAAIAVAPDVAEAEGALRRSAVEGLDPQLVEVAILRHAARTGNDYCWGHHIDLALKVGMSLERIVAIRERTAAEVDQADRVTVDYVDAVLDGQVSDGQRTAMCDVLGEVGVVKVTMLLGFYSMIGMVWTALAVEREAGVPGFDSPLVRKG